MSRIALRCLPAVVVTVPLVGYSLQSDELRSLYRSANTVGPDPLEALRRASGAAASLSANSSLGSLGRIGESLQHAFAFDIAEAASLAPNVVQGAVRIFMVAVVAWAAAAMAAAVMRSAGARPDTEPATELMPLALGTVLVAGGADGPMTRWSFTSIGVVALVLGLAVFVTRDRDMRVRSTRWHELAGVAVVGAAAATTHDLVWTGPFVAGGLVIARAAAGGQVPRLLRTAAPKRWAALVAGGLAAGVLERSVATAGRCDYAACFAGSGLSVSADSIELSARRILTGFPSSGWVRNANAAEQAGRAFGLADLIANSLLAVGVALIAAVALMRWRRMAHLAAAGSSRVSMRAAACLVALGAVVAVPPALLAGSMAPAGRPAAGEAGVDTLAVQIGWSFIVAGAASALVAAAAAGLRSTAARRTAAGVAVGTLAASMVLTLLANERLAHVDRYEPLAAVVSEISEFSVIVESGEDANTLRCRLIDEYSRTAPGTGDGPRLRAELDNLMLQRDGWPFCDPMRLSDLAPPPQAPSIQG